MTGGGVSWGLTWSKGGNWVWGKLGLTWSKEGDWRMG